MELPSEILLHIVKSANWESQDIANVTLTSKRFRLLAQPRLFQEIRFTPNSLNDQLIWQSPEYLERTLNRLGFITSSRISGSVRSVVMQTIYFFRLPPEGTIDGAKVIDAVFAAIPELTRITSLTLIGIHFTFVRISVIHGMPCLRTLSLAGPCDTDSPMPLTNPSSSIRTLHVAKFPSKPVTEWWLDLLSAEVTEEISLSCDPHESTLLCRLAEGSQLIRLRCLILPTWTIESPWLVRALSRCPNLSVLTIQETEHPDINNTRIPSEIIQSITNFLDGGGLRVVQEIRVPSEFALPFLRNCPIQCLRLWKTEDPDLPMLITSVIKEHHLDIIRFDAKFSGSSLTSWLGEVLAYPNLKELFLHVTVAMEDETLSEVGALRSPKNPSLVDVV